MLGQMRPPPYSDVSTGVGVELSCGNIRFAVLSALLHSINHSALLRVIHPPLSPVGKISSRRFRPVPASVLSRPERPSCGAVGRPT